VARVGHKAVRLCAEAGASSSGQAPTARARQRSTESFGTGTAPYSVVTRRMRRWRAMRFIPVSPGCQGTPNRATPIGAPPKSGCVTKPRRAGRPTRTWKRRVCGCPQLLGTWIPSGTWPSELRGGISGTGTNAKGNSFSAVNGPAIPWPPQRADAPGLEMTGAGVSAAGDRTGKTVPRVFQGRGAGEARPLGPPEVGRPERVRGPAPRTVWGPVDSWDAESRVCNAEAARGRE